MYAGVAASIVGHVLLILVLASGLPELFPPDDQVITTNSVGVITEEQLDALTAPNLPPAREAGASAAATAAAATAQEAATQQAAEARASQNAQDAEQAGAETAALTAAAAARSAAAQDATAVSPDAASAAVAENATAAAARNANAASARNAATTDAQTAQAPVAQSATRSAARQANVRDAATAQAADAATAAASGAPVRPLTQAELAASATPRAAESSAPPLPPQRPQPDAATAAQPQLAAVQQPADATSAQTPDAAVPPPVQTADAVDPAEAAQTAIASRLPPRRPPENAITSRPPEAATARPPEAVSAKPPELVSAQPPEAAPAQPPEAPDEPQPRDVLAQSAVTRAEAKRNRLPPRRPAHLDTPEDDTPSPGERQVAEAPQKATGKKPPKKDFFSSMQSSIGTAPTRAAPAGVEQALGLTIGGVRVSASDKAALAQRLGGCWNKPSGQRGAKTLLVELEINLDTSSNLAGAPRVLKKPPASAGRPGRLAVDRAIRAVQKCTPFNANGLILRPNSYSNWRTMRITFDPS